MARPEPGAAQAAAGNDPRLSDARTPSGSAGGDLTVQVGYRGRDEIGDVATAFRNLHVTVERLAEDDGMGAVAPEP